MVRHAAERFEAVRLIGIDARLFADENPDLRSAVAASLGSCRCDNKRAEMIAGLEQALDLEGVDFVRHSLDQVLRRVRLQ